MDPLPVPVGEILVALVVCRFFVAELTLRGLMYESLLAVGAVIWIYWGELPLSWAAEPWLLAVLAGLAAAVTVFAVALFIFYCAPDVPGVRSLRRVFREMQPMFSTLRMPHLILISVAAGVGEELFFRGALQTNSNWVVASICFGLAHVGGRDTLMYGVFAMAIGAGLSGLAAATGGLLAPIVAHTVYDAAALAFCRWGNHADPGAPAAPRDLDDREPTPDDPDALVACECCGARWHRDDLERRCAECFDDVPETGRCESCGVFRSVTRHCADCGDEVDA